MLARKPCLERALVGSPFFSERRRIHPAEPDDVLEALEDVVGNVGDRTGIGVDRGRRYGGSARELVSDHAACNPGDSEESRAWIAAGATSQQVNDGVPGLQRGSVRTAANRSGGDGHSLPPNRRADRAASAARTRSA